MRAAALVFALWLVAHLISSHILGVGLWFQSNEIEEDHNTTRQNRAKYEYFGEAWVTRHIEGGRSSHTLIERSVPRWMVKDPLLWNLSFALGGVLVFLIIACAVLEEKDEEVLSFEGEALRTSHVDGGNLSYPSGPALENKNDLEGRKSAVEISEEKIMSPPPTLLQEVESSPSGCGNESLDGKISSAAFENVDFNQRPSKLSFLAGGFGKRFAGGRASARVSSSSTTNPFEGGSHSQRSGAGPLSSRPSQRSGASRTWSLRRPIVPVARMASTSATMSSIGVAPRDSEQDTDTLEKRIRGTESRRVFLPGSSMGGRNSTAPVVPMDSDVAHGGTTIIPSRGIVSTFVSSRTSDLFRTFSDRRKNNGGTRQSSQGVARMGSVLGEGIRSVTHGVLSRMMRSARIAQQERRTVDDLLVLSVAKSTTKIFLCKRLKLQIRRSLFSLHPASVSTPPPLTSPVAPVRSSLLPPLHHPSPPSSSPRLHPLLHSHILTPSLSSPTPLHLPHLCTT